MPRSHPPSLITLVRRLVKDEKLISKGDRVLVAVSGGPDSMALLHVLAHLRDELGCTLIAHGVDHGLRPAAASELSLAASLAKKLGVSFGVSRVNVAPGGNLQSRARDARHEALGQAAAKANAVSIATGHHADDRAETFLLRLLRGSSPRGLACLPPRAGSLIRPMLLARRGDVLAHLARHRIEFADDPSNEDPRFARVRVRRELLPLMADLSPGIVAHLNGLADELGRLPDDLWPAGTRRPQREMARRGPATVRLSDCEETLVRFADGRLMVTKLDVPAKKPSSEPRRRVDGGPAGWQAGSYTPKASPSKGAAPAARKRKLGERKRRP
jgi:tRNA(Ile)-lysidine synthase